MAEKILMKQLIENYNRDGYVHLKNYLSGVLDLNAVASVGLDMRKRAHEYSKWKGISCASKHSTVLEEFYTSVTMKTLAKKFLGDDCYYFNDQIVYKLPHETDFVFEAHYDNQYGPNIDNKIHTVNFCVILDDFEVPLQVKCRDEWISLHPDKGDIIAIRGDTYHRSSGNTTDKPRGLYACVYTKEPILMDGFYSKKL